MFFFVFFQRSRWRNDIRDEAKMRSLHRRATGEPTRMLHLYSHHDASTHQQLLFFHTEEGCGMFSIFLFFFLYEFQIPKPTQGKDDTL